MRCRSRRTTGNGNAGTNPSEDPFTLTALKVKWDLGFASLFSNTSFYDRNQKATSDYTQYLRATWAYFAELANTYGEPGDHGYALFQDTQRNFYQEFRLASSDPNARLVWSTGLFYSHLKENVPESIVDTTLNPEIINYTAAVYPTTGPFPLCVPTQPCPNGYIYNGPVDQVIDKQIAIFGDATFKITDTGWGTRISDQAMPHLGGARVGPYEFQAVWHGPAGDTPVTLIVDTDVKYYDRTGREISNGRLRQATKLKETFSAIEIEAPR